ncbi:MAG: hypothetical protein DI613_15715 [Kocuria rhizophila]|nr:MAG: hypothetical protein DI613_15715 [Kocuria rhizophila]
MNTWLVLAAGIGSGVLGGFYIAFSLVVMPALRLRPRDEATATMRAINRAAVQAPFLVLFFGTAVLCVATVLNAFFHTQLASDWRSIGAVLSLAGTFLTMVVNIPLNNQLTRDNVRLWQHYERSWTRANHVRAVLSVLGAVVLLMPMGVPPNLE